MKITDVRIDGKLNKFVWSNDVRNVLTRVRVRLSRRRNLNNLSRVDFWNTKINKKIFVSQEKTSHMKKHIKLAGSTKLVDRVEVCIGMEQKH